MIEFTIDPKSGVPFHRQLADQIRYGIATGQLEVGEQLPTVRALAVELSVNPNTISRVYRELEIRDILVTQQGTGTFVGPVAPTIPIKERQQKLRSICDELITQVSSYGFSIGELIEELAGRQGEER